MADVTSQLILSLVDHITGPSRVVAAAISRMQDRIALNNRALAATQSQFAGAAVAAVGLAQGLGRPITAALAFESALTDIGLKADLAGAKLAEVQATIRAVGLATGQGAAETAKSVDTLMGFGGSFANSDVALAAVEPIGRAATAYNAATEDLAAASVAVVDTLKVDVSQLGYALDIMAAAGKSGAFELKDMAAEFPAITASAEALGIKGTAGVADLVAMLEVARKGAASGSEAATNTQNFLSKLTSKDAVKNFRKFGVNVTKELEKAAAASESPVEHMLEVIDRITEGGRPEKINELFGDMQVVQFLRPLLANMEEYRRIRDEALKAAGTVQADFDRRMATAGGATKRFSAQMENLSLVIGAALLPALADVLDRIAPVVEAMGRWVEAHPALTRAIVATTAALVALRIAAIAARFSFAWMGGAFLAAGVAGLRGVQVALAALLTPITAVRRALVLLRSAFLLTGVGAAIVAVGAAGVWLANNFDRVRAAVAGAWESFSAGAPGVAGALSGVASAVERVVGFLERITGPDAASVDEWRDWGRAVGAALADAVPELPVGLQRMLNGQFPFDLPPGLQGLIGALTGEQRSDAVSVQPVASAPATSVLSVPAVAPVGAEDAQRALDLARQIQAVYDDIASKAEQAGRILTPHDVLDPAALAQLQSMQAQLSDLTAGLSPQAQADMAAFQAALAAGGAAAKAEADRIGAAIVAGLSVTARPTIDTSSLDAAAAKIRGLVALMGDLSRAGAAPARAAASVPSVTPRAKGGPVRPGQLYLYGEDGPELGYFGRPGRIIDATTSSALMQPRMPDLPAPRSLRTYERDDSRASSRPPAPAAAPPVTNNVTINLGGITMTGSDPAAAQRAAEEIVATIGRRLSRARDNAFADII